MANQKIIAEVMTKNPSTVGKHVPIKKVAQLMRENRLRHLPVEERGKIIGMISDRDVKLASGFADPATLTAEEIMTPDPYVVKPDTKLNDVVSAMAEHKYGSCIIENENHHSVGIFTSVDALRLLAEYLA